MADFKENGVVSEDVTNRIARLVSKCINFYNTNIINQWQANLEQYLTQPQKGDDRLKGTSKHIVPVLRDHVDLFTSQVIRILDGQKNVVSFSPLTNSPQDKATAKQQTSIVRHVLREKNSHTALLGPWVKNSGLFGLGVVYVDFIEEVEEGLEEDLKGVTPDQLVQLVEQEKKGDVIIIARGDEYRPEIPDQIIQQITAMNGGQPIDISSLDPAVVDSILPMVIDLKVRRIKKQPQFILKTLAPEDFVVSVDADFCPMTGGVKASVQGHRSYTTKAALIEQGYDDELVESIPTASDKTSGIATVRASKTSFDTGISDNGELVEIYEIFTKIKIGDDKKPRHYRVTIGGNPTNSPIILGYVEVSKYYPYAALCPYPLPNSLFGQGLGDRLGGDQHLQTQIYRAILNNLHYSIDPVRVVNPETTNIDDVLNLHPGKVIRSEDVSAGISYSVPPFVAQNALPIIDLIDQRNEMSTGVGKSMVSIDASDLQDVTATAARQRSASQQLMIEQVCRNYADTGYRYLAKVIIDLCTQNKELASRYLARLTDDETPFLPVDTWDSDMDVSTDVTFGSMDRDLKQASLMTLLQLQQQGLGQVATPQNLYTTLIELTETIGIQGASAFWTDPASMPPAPPPPDPNAGLIEIEKVKAQLRAEEADKDRVLDWAKTREKSDLERDKMAQEFAQFKMEIQKELYGIVNLVRETLALNAEQEKQRSDVDWARYAQRQSDEQMQAAEQAKAMAAQQPMAAQVQQAPMQQPQQFP